MSYVSKSCVFLIPFAAYSAIAIQIMKPVRSRGYEEILVYVRVPGGDIDAATRRIQWTPNGGYVETVYGAPR